MRHELERDVQRTVIDWLRLWGAVPVRVNSGATKVGKRFVRFNDEPGCSDLLVCLPDGMFAAVEVKRPGGKLTPHQRAFLDFITSRNGLGLVVRSLDELKTALRAEGYDTETHA